MNLEKLFYVIISTVLLTIFILFTFIFSPSGLNTKKISDQKTIYFVDHISVAHQKVIDLFNARNKGKIKVETINLSFDKFSTNERKELLARYLRSKNNRIDIFTVDQIWVPRFARWGISLNNYFDSTDIKTIIPNALETSFYKDSLVAVPLYIDIALMYYRDDLLKKFPDYNQLKYQLQNSITWEEFIKLGVRFNPSINPFFIFQADDYEGLICSFAELMASMGNPIIDSDENLYLNSPEGKKSLQLLVNLVNKYRLSPAEVSFLKENESYKFFVKNNGVFLRGWPSMIDDDNEFLTDEIKSHLRMVPLPHFNNSKPSSIYGGWNLMISKFSEKIPEVIKFAKFLLSDESQKIMYEEGGYLPISKRLYENEQLLNKHSELKFFNRLYSTGVHRPFVEDYTNISDILSFYLNKAIKKEISVDKALEEVELKIKDKSILLK